MLKEELDKLVKIAAQSKLRNFLIQDDDKAAIADIFSSVDDARKELLVSSRSPEA